MFWLLLAYLVVSPVRVVASPHFSSAPSTIELRIHITPDQRNRKLILVWGDEMELGRSEMTLDDELANFTRIIVDVPAGDYTVKATLIRTDGTYCSQDTFEVIK